MYKARPSTSLKAENYSVILLVNVDKLKIMLLTGLRKVLDHRAKRRAILL